MKVNGILEQHISIYVTPQECIDQLLNNYFNNTNPYDIVEDNNALYREFDISEHGSPVIRRELITKDPEKIKLFQCLFESKKIIEKLCK